MTAFMDELDALVGDDHMAHDPKVSAIKKLVERHYGGRESAEIEFDREFTVRGIDRWWCHGCGESIDVRGGMPAPCFCPWCGAERKAEPPEVLDADGVPIHIGDTLYTVHGTAIEVVEIGDINGEPVVNPRGSAGAYWADRLSHTEPDSRERVRNTLIGTLAMGCTVSEVDDALARIDALVAAGRWSE